MSDLLTELQCTKPPPNNCFRLIVLGSAKVGKTAIVRRFLHQEFHDTYVPTIEDFHRKIYKIRGEVFQLDILDTSGSIQTFPAMRRCMLLTGDAFLLVYSIDSRESFEEVLRLREQIGESIRSANTNNCTKNNKPKNLPIPMLIAGNKSDKEVTRAVAAGEVAHVLSRIKDGALCSFVECSAKNNQGIVDAFGSLFTVADFPEEMIPSTERRISLTHGGNIVPRRVDSGRNGLRRRHGLSLRRRLSDAYSALILNVRRPSIRTDLVMVQTKAEQLATPRSKRRRHKSSVRRTDSYQPSTTDSAKDSSIEIDPYRRKAGHCCIL
ncbi:hypothetical protein RvY_15569-2 [Ramazzottius varieornatus]|uniref:Uncharacterized protein n=1 Tax=Ramazzottius varieornatus TaxID=947166 RepID=A0A1D1W259_RAMVA|nr:hypothetical protein RvY_15569-2 [Ramazzottius varieornatus]